jgi:hypothetical protein
VDIVTALRSPRCRAFGRADARTPGPLHYK